MVADEADRGTARLFTLIALERASGSHSAIEHLTCAPGASAGLNVALPPDDAEYNAASIGLRILERNRIRCQDSALEPRLRAPLDREREHKSRLSRMSSVLPE